MNYYGRYPGDYARDTGHLTLTEHGVYSVLLDAYYSTECPLPADFVLLYRICRAMDDAERAAVRSVAEQFFPISDDGLRHNGRADAEIPKARKRIQAAVDNGKTGGRPTKKKPSGNPVGYSQKPSGFDKNNPVGYPVGYPAETQWQSSPTPTPNSSLPFQGDDSLQGDVEVWGAVG